jgi:hypothetical protein
MKQNLFQLRVAHTNFNSIMQITQSHLKVATGTIPAGFAYLYPSPIEQTYTHTRSWVRDQTHTHTHVCPKPASNYT